MIRVILPGTPQGKGRPRFGGGRTYTPAATRAYERALQLVARRAMGGTALLDGALVVDVLAVFSPPASWSKARREAALRGDIYPTGRPDVDNLLKTVDAMNGVVWGDDSQIVDARARKIYGVPERIEITVSRVGEA